MGDDLEKRDVMEANFTFFFDNRITERLVPCLRFNHIRPIGHQMGHQRNLAQRSSKEGKLTNRHWLVIIECG